MTEETAELTRQSQAIYRQFVEPLEADHQGDCVAVSEDGSMVVAPTLLEVMEEAQRNLAPGSFLFKVGDIAIDTWR